MLLVVDPRTGDWLLMESPIPTLQLTALYLVFVYIGPKFMKNREPFDCKMLLAAYNLALVALNLYIFLEVSLVSMLMYSLSSHVPTVSGLSMTALNVSACDKLCCCRIQFVMSKGGIFLR